MKSVLKVAVVALTLALLSTSAQARNPREHDGFFLRLSAGGGHADTEIDDAIGEGETELSGPAGDYNFAVGGIVGENLAVHGTAFGWWVKDPDMEVFDDSGAVEEGSLGGWVNMNAWGGGITYYLMPINVYFSGSVAAAMLTFGSGPYDTHSDVGFAGDFTVGKEWWAGNDWGLGFNGGMSLHTIPASETDQNWSGKTFALRFSATFN